jgi:hypothetical protein
MKSNRRDLLKKAAIGGSMLAGLNLAACTKSDNKTAETGAKADPAPNGGGSEAAGLEYVKPDNSTAKALGYVEDATALEEGARPDKGATKGADQFCTNCQFYTEVDGNGGKCSLFPGKLVKARGWCRSWSLKAQL